MGMFMVMDGESKGAKVNIYSKWIEESGGSGVWQARLQANGYLAGNIIEMFSYIIISIIWWIIIWENLIGI